MTDNPLVPHQPTSTNQTSAQSTSADLPIVPDSSSEYMQQAMSDVLTDTLPALSSASSISNGLALASPPRPWGLPAWQARFFVFALATATLAIFLRLFQLDRLQAEMYGDIVTVYEYIDSIRKGLWPTQYALAVGPLYPYAITPVLALVGPPYFGLKLSAAIASLGVLAATYALGRRLVDDYFALLATFVAGVSSWLLIFSRLGDVQIIVPLLTTCALWLAMRAIQRGSLADLIACAVVSTLGLYAHAQSFILPAAMWLTLLCLRWAGQPVSWRMLVRFALVAALCSLPFAWIVSRDPANFFSGYIGRKLAESQEPFSALLANVTHGLLALHVHGDINFRSNPAGLPHLDWLSGILFLVGVAFWLHPERRRWSPLLFVPLILLQLPSILVLSRADEVPSASRTLGIAPLAYILVASGVWWMIEALKRYARSRVLTYLVSGALLVAIVLLNAQRYFQTYLSGLPYQNTAIGHAATAYIDSLPPDTQVYLAGCCWEAGMPEPKGIQYSMAHPENLHEVEPNQLNCQELQSFIQPAVVIWSFHSPLPNPQLAACQRWLPAQLHASPRGLPTFYAATLHLDQSSSTGVVQPSIPNPQPAVPDSQPAGELVAAQAQLNGETVEVRSSPLDIGQAADLFDGKRETLIRGKSANPFVLELHFTQPRAVSLITLDLGSLSVFQVSISLESTSGSTRHIVQVYKDLPPDPHLEFPIDQETQPTSMVRIEILHLRPPADATHIHVRELSIR